MISRSTDRQTEQFQDPKIILTASILKQRDSIVAHINTGRATDALKGMATLISQLDLDPEKPELTKAREELTKNSMQSYLPSSSVMHYFQLINDYLNLTYFADFHNFRFQNPKPKHIGT